jgi:arginyl-tRNA synthetase
VIGDAICRTLRFLGHRVVSDNHVGDWGTQFGMVIYGYRNFLDEGAYGERPVQELSRLYKLVSRLVDYHDSRAGRAGYVERVAQRDAALERLKAQPAGDPAAAKKQAAAVRKAEAQCAEAREELAALDAKIRAVDDDPQLAALAAAHPAIGEAVLTETARLHAGDVENRRLWEEVLPYCREDMQRIYRRLGVTFDQELGESFYHDQLPGTVADLERRGMARESEGATCVFLDGFDTPMIIRKKDGAFLYATTDLATIQYRAKTWNPDVVLYVVDHRQGEHFAKLFAAAKQWGYDKIDLRHISFGTVLGEDGRPYKTRSGDTVGLEGLLDEGVRKALEVVSTNDDRKPIGAEFSAEERQAIAQTVGIAALKYADLSQNRTSDYIFSYDKMLALDGNTAASMQYFYARVQGIFRKLDRDPAALRTSPGSIVFTHPTERALAIGLLRFPEALDESVEDFRPNLITAYLYELTRTFFAFYEACSVRDAETDAIRDSRLRLCDLAGRVIRQGLELLGIRVIDRM